MSTLLSTSDRVGLLKPALDAHTLGLHTVRQLLEECRCPCVIAPPAVVAALDDPLAPDHMEIIEQWLHAERVTVLGFSYRLDPATGVELFGRLLHALKGRRLLATQGGPLRALHFAGLPEACQRIHQLYPEVTAVHGGDAGPAETLRALGVDPARLPRTVTDSLTYDETRMAFARDLIRRGLYLAIRPPDRSGYPGYGTRQDRLVTRLAYAARRGELPLLRAHAGPYVPDREAAVRLFLDWTRQLAAAGLLDVLSIGTSQLTQSAFGMDWNGLPNGGGVPLNSPEEFAAVWQAARPMLVRTYAGTRNLPDLAEMYERTINNAWHALSLWWFCRLDGRGPYDLRENLQQQFAALRVAARSGKPYEPNVAHHFAFRGADDVTTIVATVLAMRAARAVGIRHVILQVMLNTPRGTWGLQDLAKARSLLTLARELEDDSFRVFLQPRGGLDHFSPDPDRARMQLAAVTALMDDIEPANSRSPPLIHVVSYSEGRSLATPEVINESLQITRCALVEYRRLKARGETDDMRRHPEVTSRTAELEADARQVLAAIERTIKAPYTPEGLYSIFAAGYLPVPDLAFEREDFPAAVGWQTRLWHGGVRLVDGDGTTVSVAERLARIATALVTKKR